MKLGALAVLIAMCFPALSNAVNPEWKLVRSPHFDVYSQAGERNGQCTALWLERLRAFFIRAGVTSAGGDLEGHGPVRVIVFDSVRSYAPFRPDPSADAFFLSGPGGDYLVMSTLGTPQFAIAAHEYAHLVVHSMGVRLPPWLEEGVAEFFSTVRISEREGVIGGDLPMRTLALRQSAWIPLREVLTATSPMRADRKQTNLFYAESWLLTDMLIFSPKYGSRLPEFMGEMASGASGLATIERVYGMRLSGIEADLRAWLETSRTAAPLPGISGVTRDVRVSTLDEFAYRRVLADVLAGCGRLDEAQSAYRILERERPLDATIAAALGMVALRKGETEMARKEWKRAVELGIRDAQLCYNYAILAENAGLPAPEIRDALRRAVALAPEFDDARYKLGLLDSNSGNYQGALAQFHAMHSVSKTRAYAYWIAMASAYTETDERDAATAAANKALNCAATAEERATALRLAYIAQTDLTVQVSRDANGKLQMVTARKPHGSDDWNPFIEPGDQMRRLEGQIRKVECQSGKITGFRIESASAAVEVALPDPAHVLIQGGTPEFVCGADDGRKVYIEYAASTQHAAADGVLRGMRFR